ncbi:MAG: LamG-like jellyroll fold domain-containing protein [Candidatus Omnitrophota bacterium]
MNKPKTGQGYRFTTVVLSSILLLLSSAYLYMVWAVETKAWDFATASDYTVYKGDGSEDTDNDYIIVDEGVAKLVAQLETESDDSLSEYAQGTKSSTVTGPDTSLVLTKSGGVYNSTGEYTSRVFDGGAGGNVWTAVKSSTFNTNNRGGVRWAFENGPLTGYAVLLNRGTQFDASAIYSPSVIKDGETYKMWYTGNVNSVYRIGYATSTDGLNWTRVDGPQQYLSVINISTDRFDKNHAGFPSVIKDGETYKMWYSGYNGEFWRVGYATSPDGINWTKYDGPEADLSVLDVSLGRFDSAHAYAPTVIKDGSVYRMWYMGFDGDIYRIGYATSPDGINWTKVNGYMSGGAVLEPGLDFESGVVYYPCVIKDGSFYKMWYYQTGVINYAFSPDGITWTKVNGLARVGGVLEYYSPYQFCSNYCSYPCVIKDGSTYKMWPGGNGVAFGYATSTEDTIDTTWTYFQVRSGTTANLTDGFVGPDGTSATYYPGNYHKLVSAGNFNTSHRYAQFKLYMYTSGGGLNTPVVDWAGFTGTKVNRIDDTLSDFSSGSFTSNTTTLPVSVQTPFVGLAQKDNGEYNAVGSYTSRVFDGGDGAVWNSIAWTKGMSAIDPSEETGLVGLYHFDSSAADSSGHGNDGTWTGAPAYDTTNQRFGTGCFKNNGGANYITLPLSDTLKRMDAFTFSYWTMYDFGENSAFSVGLYDSRNTSKQDISIQSYVNSAYLYARDRQLNAFVHLTSSYQLSYWLSYYKEWQHIAVTWDGGPVPQSFAVYVNGIQLNVDSKYITDSYSAFYKIRELLYPIEIGHCYTPSADRYFSGYADEIAIYNRALSADEILRLYQKGAGIKFQCRSSATNPPTGNFVGPDGTANTYYSTAAGSNFGAEIPANRYFQYKAYFEGCNSNTPALESVKVTYNTSSDFTDDSRSEFDEGSYDNSKTKCHLPGVSIENTYKAGVLPTPDDDPGLIALYHFDGDLVDASGNGHNGTLYDPNNYMLFLPNSKVGSYAFYHGSQSYTYYANLGTIDTPADMSISFWYRPVGTASGPRILSDYSSVTGKFQKDISFNAGDRLCFSQYHSDGSAVNVYADYVSMNKSFRWQHVAIIRDDTAKSIRLYADGKLVGTSYYPGKTVLPISDAGDLYIGQYGNLVSNSYQYICSIDELAIYNRVLTEEEIMSKAGMQYVPGEGKTFASRTMDAGLAVDWSRVLWGENTSGYGNGLNGTPVTGQEIQADEKGLVGLWHLNGDWIDVMGRRNGTRYGTTAFDSTGQKLGSACDTFDGSTQSVLFGNIGSTIRTVEFWLNSTSYNCSVMELKDNDNYIGIGYVSYSDTRYIKLTGTPLSSGTIYVNGDVYGQAKINPGWNHVVIVTTSDIPASSMRLGEAANVYYNGKLDEVAVYNRILSQSEARQHYFDQTGDGGLVALWHMDNDWTDATGKGHDGTAYNGATFTSDSKFGAAAGSFDGTDDYVVFNDADFPKYSGVMTIEGWFKTTAAANQAIFSYGTPANSFSVLLYIDGSNTLSSYAYCVQSPTLGTSYTNIQANDGQWHHFADVMRFYDRQTSGTRMYHFLYFDGEYRSQSICYTLRDTGSGIWVGARPDGTMPFNGSLDEIAVYSRYLHGQEIADHYLRGVNDIKMQVSTDGGTTWKDNEGSAGSYITETPASLSLGGPSQTIKYRATLSTTDYRYSPLLRGVDFSKASYPTDDPYVIPDAGQEYIGYLTSFTQTVGSRNLGTIKYLLSNDDGSTWYRWDGSNWVSTTSGYVAANTASDINTNIGQFYEDVGAGTLNFKAFLHSDGIQPVELDNVSLGYAPGKITVTTPNGGETLLSGGYADIKWTAAGTIASDTWDLAYSTDGGSNWTPIAANQSIAAVEGVYTYNWSSIPNVQSVTTKVKVTNNAENSIHDASNANFTLALGFQVTAPNGGEKWYVGSSGNNIQWKSSSGMGTTVRLYYTLNGTDYTAITTSTSNQYSGVNTYAWTIGSSASDDGLYSETAKIKVTNQSGQNEDASDAVFTMAGMKLIQPNGSEQIKRGGSYEIQWKSAGAGSTVKLEYSTDSGETWNTITESESNSAGTDSYEWNVPAGCELSSEAKVRITSNSDANLTDASDGIFTIADLIVNSPNGGEIWQAGSTSNPVTWVFVGSAGVGKVTVSYSTDSGSTWTVYNNNVDNQQGPNSYNWTVPFAPSDNIRVKVVDNTSGSTMADSSDGNFSIAGVKVTLPNGSETYGIDSANFIRWSANNASDTGAIYYSVDGGSTWSASPIVGAEEVLLSQGATGFSWTPSNDPGTVPTVQARVKVVALTPASDANPPVPLTLPMEDSSDANFTIRGLRVTAPALNASWLLGSSHDIQWTSAGTTAETATLYYSVIGDFSDQVAITATPVTNNEIYPGNNSYTWNIGASVTPSATAKIKVTAGAYNALSPAFTLKGIKVTAPASGATVTQNVASSVIWSSAGIDGNVNIYYSSDNGSTYSETPINASPINITAGTYSWTPNTAILTPSTSAKLKIQVVSGSDSGLFAESAQFTLKGIKISAPAAGTTWELGQTQSITWTAAGVGSTCNIYYAADGTNFTSTVNSSAVLLSAGTYSWTIPASITPSNGTAKIRITSDTNVSSSSGAFTIKGIKVTNPTATTIWEVGESVTISHAVVGALSALNVYYVKDGIETQIGTVMPNSSFPWVVTADAEGPGIIIRLKSFMPNYTGDSPAFQIVGEASLAVSEPSAASSWKVSETNTITWTRSGSTERTFTVEYDDNAAFTSPTPITGTPAYDGAGLYSLDWAVPDNVGTCYIKVTDTGNSNITDISEAFKIIPKFRVNIPNGGETLYALKPGTTVNWGTTGSAGTVDLYYSTDTPLYETWTKINSTAIPDNGTGTVERITSYSWTVPNIQSTVVKIKVQASSAGLSGAYDVSDDVFTIKYYKVTWNVKSATTGDHLDKLFVIDSSGWSEADLTSPIERYYPYGDSYNTNWSRADYFDKAERGWETDQDNKVINITMSESSLAPEYHVMSNFSYNASQDKFLINSWVERGGVILAKPSSCVVHIYDASGGPIQQLTATTYDANGVFWQEWPTTNLDQNAMYFAKVDIVYSGETYSSGLSYSLNIPKAIAGLGTTVAQQLTDLQTAIGTDLATQTTAIGAKIDTLETSIGTNLDAKISTVKTDIAAVKTVVDKISEDVGAIGGDLATPISEAVAEDLAAQLAKGIQAEILTRPTSAGFGTATDIRFRTATGMSPTITVYDANNVARIAAAAMVEVGTTGIYEYALTPQSAWGAGEYTVVCEEPTKNAIDSMVLSVSESVGAGAGTDEGMVNSINATVTTIDSNVKTMLSKVNTLPDDTTDVGTSVSSLLATVGKTTDAAGTNTLFGKIASAQGDITAFKADITNYVDGVETTLGTTADAAGTNTVYGKIRSLEQTLSALGPDGAKANKELLAAKDQAAAASKAAEDIKKMIAAGGKNAEAYGALQKLAGDLAKLQAANSRIGSSVTADSITDFIRDTRAKLAQVAMKEGYDNLVPETGEVGQVNLTEEADVEDLRNNMTELKALLSQVRSLLDKQVNAPVVKSWIEGK